VKATGDISTTFHLDDTPTTRAAWPNHFQLTLTVLLKPTALSLQLRVQNLNSDGRPFSFTSLLHTYLLVDDITKTTVRGLQGRQYVDQVDGRRIKDKSEAIIFREEVDRMYIDGGLSPVRVNDGGNCELMVKSTGFRDVVVWNPHVEKTKTMADMPPDDWKRFVCVEPGSVIEPITLEAGKTWEGAMGVSIQMMPDSDVARTVAERTLATTGKL
jgi:glucose-6-phosphate 1-epimerase